MLQSKRDKALKNKKKMQSGLQDYHALRRAYIEEHGAPPPKGTKKADLEAMGLKSKTKRKKRKTKSRTKKSNSGSTVFNWKNAFWS